MYIVKCPKSDYTGTAYGMSFTGSVAQTENSRLAARLKDKGYLVEKSSEPDPAARVSCSMCGKTYASVETLEKHMKKEHPDHKLPSNHAEPQPE